MQYFVIWLASNSPGIQTKSVGDQTAENPMGVNTACKRSQRKWGVSSGGGSAVSDVRGVLQRHKLSDLLGMSHVQDPEHHTSETDPWVWKLYAYLEDLQLWKHYRLPRPRSPGKRCFHERLGDIFTKHNHDFPWMLAMARLSFVGVYVKCLTVTVVHNLQGCHCCVWMKGRRTSPASVRINDYSTGFCGVLPDDAQYQPDDVF